MLVSSEISIHDNGVTKYLEIQHKQKNACETWRVNQNVLMAKGQECEGSLLRNSSISERVGYVFAEKCAKNNSNAVIKNYNIHLARM